jgi:hypothetical protein
LRRAGVLVFFDGIAIYIATAVPSMRDHEINAVRNFNQFDESGSFRVSLLIVTGLAGFP